MTPAVWMTSVVGPASASANASSIAEESVTSPIIVVTPAIPVSNAASSELRTMAVIGVGR